MYLHKNKKRRDLLHIFCVFYCRDGSGGVGGAGGAYLLNSCRVEAKTRPEMIFYPDFTFVLPAVAHANAIH